MRKSSEDFPSLCYDLLVCDVNTDGLIKNTEQIKNILLQSLSHVTIKK